MFITDRNMCQLCHQHPTSAAIGLLQRARNSDVVLVLRVTCGPMFRFAICRGKSRFGARFDLQEVVNMGFSTTD
ncbi:hypothetical protein COOONC_25230 [Cooperia oncophora]